MFECTCGVQFAYRLEQVYKNMRDLGWSSCRDCYFAVGGYDAIVKMNLVSED